MPLIIPEYETKKLFLSPVPSHSEARRNVMSPRVEYLEGSVDTHRFRWVGHVLDIPSEGLARCAFCGK